MTGVLGALLGSGKVSGGGSLGLQTSCTAFWELESTSWSDATGNSNTLTPSGSAPTIVSGLVGNAAHFVTGSSQSLNIASNTNLAVGGGNFSLQCWVKADANGAWLSKNDGGFANREWDFRNNFTSSNVYAFEFYLSGGSSVIVNSTVNNDSTAYHHLVATWDGTTIRFYVDAGTAVTNVPGSGSLASTSSVFIGENGQNATFANGNIDQVGIWKGRVLSSSDVTALYNSGAGLSWAAMA
jgi:hypothetical protein